MTASEIVDQFRATAENAHLGVGVIVRYESLVAAISAALTNVREEEAIRAFKERLSSIFLNKYARGREHDSLCDMGRVSLCPHEAIEEVRKTE